MLKIVESELEHGICVGELAYGTLLRGIPGHRDVVYLKVKKRSCGAGISIDFSRNHSVLLNVLYGTVRQVRGDLKVIPLEAELHVQNSENPQDHCK